MDAIEKYLCSLQSATSLDENNGLYPVAFAVVKGKKVSWSWFPQHLKPTLESDMDHITIISDQQKGLHEVVTKLFPCAKHTGFSCLWKNFMNFTCRLL